MDHCWCGWRGIVVERKYFGFQSRCSSLSSPAVVIGIGSVFPYHTDESG